MKKIFRLIVPMVFASLFSGCYNDANDGDLYGDRKIDYEKSSGVSNAPTRNYLLNVNPVTGEIIAPADSSVLQTVPDSLSKSSTVADTAARHDGHH